MSRAVSRNTPEERNERLLAMAENDPEGFAELLRKVANTMLVPHSDGQKEVLTAEERFLVLCAGRRWGKTKVGAARALREARTSKKIIWWVAPTYKVVKRGYAEIKAQIPDNLLTKPAPPDSVFDAGRSIRLTFKNGSVMEFYSAERPEGMLGGSCDFALLDEAATMPEHVWTQILRPTLADRQGSALFISTPRGLNWFYYVWSRGQSADDKDKEFRSWHFPSRTNPTIPSSEFDQMAEEMPAAEYEQEVLAEFISQSASVFRFPKAFDEDGKQIEGTNTALRPLQQPIGHICIGIDLAKHNDFTVITAVRSADRMPCYHERFNQVSWPIQKTRIKDAINSIESAGNVEGVTILMDVGGPGDVIFDDLEMEGYDIVPINFTKWKEQAVKLLVSDIEQGRAFVHPEQLSEFQHYTYSITPAGRWKYEAAKGHDDEVSAALLAHWGVVHEGAPSVQTLSIDMTGADSYSGMDAYDEDYIDYDDVQVDDGLPRTTQTYSLRPPSAAELLNNPGLW